MGEVDAAVDDDDAAMLGAKRERASAGPRREGDVALEMDTADDVDGMGLCPRDGGWGMAIRLADAVVRLGLRVEEGPAPASALPLPPSVASRPAPTLSLSGR